VLIPTSAILTTPPTHPCDPQARQNEAMRVQKPFS